MSVLRVGDLLQDCNRFGHKGGPYPDYRVEAVGADWVVARGEDGEPYLYKGIPENLCTYAEWWLHGAEATD